MLLAVGVVAVVGITLVFVGYGVAHDLRVASIDRRSDAARHAMAAVLFEDEEDAAGAFPQLLKLPRSLLLRMIQNVTVDVGDAATDRLRALVVDARLTRRIRALQRKHSWRRRVQAAHLEHLLPLDDPGRFRLLHDRYPLVRARAAESLSGDDAAANALQLFEMLDDPVHAVRAGAQQALLRSDGSIAEPLCEYLWSGGRVGTNLALEVAANLPDPRYGSVLRHYANDTDPVRRAMVCRAIGAGGTLDSSETLARLIADDDASVRAAAATAVGSLGRSDLAGALGHMLSDAVWGVRRAAALALTELAPTGHIVLRAHLFDGDRYARDMARQVLDAEATRRRLPAVVVPEDLPPLEDSFEGIA